MNHYPGGNGRTVFHKSSLWSIMGQGAVEWMHFNRSAQACKKLKYATFA